ALIAEHIRSLGLVAQTGLAVTGVKAILQGRGGPGPTVALLGELDALPVWDHPDHDPETGAVHACCHHAQVAAMFGAAAGLVDSGVLDSLSGRVALIAVPAEEYVE